MRNDLSNDSRPAGAPLHRVLPALALVVLLAAAVSLAGIAPLRAVLGLWHLGARANPYWVPEHALSLYVVTPLTALATSLFLLAPGLILAAVFGAGKRAAAWLVSGLAISLVLLSAVTSLFQLASGVILRGGGFFALVLGVIIACLAIAALRLRAGHASRLRLAGEAGDLWIAAGIFWLFLALLAPKFYWENFSGDGSGALQFARLHIARIWPFWMDEAGTIKQAPGLTSVLFVLPESWFVRLWGETEFSVRIPHMLYLALLFPVLTALVRVGRTAVPGLADRAMIAAALFVYSVSVIYSGGYHSYFGDSPMPAARETLAMVAFMAYILFFIEDRCWLMAAAGIMGYLSIPTGGLWLVLWPAAVIVTWRPLPRRRLIAAAAVLAVAGAVAILGPVLIRLAGLPVPGAEFSAEAVVTRLRFVAFTDWNRFAFLAVPGGIVPALFLLTWRWQDRIARALTLVTVVFFLFFYLQGYRVLLHHFIPAMIPPIVILWRSALLQRAQLALPLRLGAGLGLVGALWLAWPNDIGMHGFERSFGQFIATEGPRYDSAPRAEGERFRGFEPKALDTFHELFGRLLPQGYEDDTPKERFYGAPLVWWYYSEFPKPEGQVVNYVLKPLAAARPEDGTLFDSYDGYGLFIRDQALFEAHRGTILPADTGAPILMTKRSVIFGRGAKWGDRIVIDLVPLARRLLGLGNR